MTEPTLNAEQTNQWNKPPQGQARKPFLLRAMSRFWQSLWHGKPPNLLILLLSMLTALIMVIPILYVVVQGWGAGTERWIQLWDSRIPGLLWNTLSLTAVVTAGTILIGVTFAFLVVRTDLPGRKWWRLIGALPLVIPPYVGAMAYIIIFGPTGWVRDWFGSSPVQIYSFWGVVMVMTMFTYPYVYLITAASLGRLNANLEEAALSCGQRYRQVFLKVVLPLLRPAVGAGAILVSLYVLSDFGAISIMRYTTFTAAIYYQMGSFDRVSAAMLSVVLIAVTLIFLWMEWRTRKNIRYSQQGGTYRRPLTIPLGRWKPLALAFVFLVSLTGVFLPLAVLIYWSLLGLQNGAIDASFWEYTVNSLVVSGIAALLSVILAMPLVYLKARNPSLLTSLLEKVVYSSYALPGVIVSLGIVFVFNQYLPMFYGTIALLVTAYIMRFLPQATQAGEAAISLVSPRLDEAAQSLGHSPWKSMLKITLPMVLPGVLAGAALVFVSSMKELPATLLLRPAGYDTLAVRIWIQASEGFYHLAAPAALLVILVSILPLRWILNKY
ncbi:ABC transporter permease [Desmospora profundinema]|uniref:Iron(III) transport system permease protein n=1 Tax=Desmospora profundinema TaxID=1571184 RepID=A0ABU1ILJ8_9BACL|nr:iron ABC transporter permease [Desmospora profundinema]MDR6225288.1 iron(III) transport system permease protein [Desmospora profundinema]